VHRILNIALKHEAKVIWWRLHRMTLHSEAESQWSRVIRDRWTDWQIDTVYIGNNSLHLMHSMQPKKLQNFIKNYSLTVISKYWQQNMSVSVKFVSAVTGPEVTFADNAIGHVRRSVVNPWNARLHCSNYMASQQSWSQPGRLLDLGKLQKCVYCSCIHDVS